MHFSPREQEILHLLAQYHTYAEMATLLGICRGTVHTYIERISIKTDVHTQVKLIHYAIEHGYGSAETAKKGDSN